MTDETTDPNFKVRLKEIIAATDPIIDKLLLKVAASGWSPVIVVAYTIATIAVGIWIGHSP